MSLMLEPNPTQIKEERIYAEMGLTDEESLPWLKRF